MQLQIFSSSTSMYDIDVPLSITPDSTVTVPNVQVDNEKYALQCIDQLSPDHDDDYDINCYMTKCNKP